MEVRHRTYNLKISPRKLRLVADKIKHQPVDRALELLPLIPNKGAELIATSLKAALKMAEDQDLVAKSLQVQRVNCDEGRKLRRIVPQSRGRAARLVKRYCHLTLVLKGESIKGKKSSKTSQTEVQNQSTNSEKEE